MSSKGRFKIPTGNEMAPDTSSSMNPMSMFASYKQKRAAESVKSKPDNAATASSSRSDKGTKSSADGPSNLNARKANSTAGTSSTNIFAPKARVANPKASASYVPPTVAPPPPPSSSSSSSTKTVMMSDPKPAPSAATTSTSTEASTATAGKTSSSNSIIVNYRQRGNPILKHIRNVAWEYGSIVPDYVMGKANCALYLSLRYHQLNAQYLHTRLKELGKGYDLRVLLVHVDVADPHHLLRDLAKICILVDCTLILAFSTEEAGRYLESFKVYENKPAEALMEKTDNDYMSKLTDSLTSVKSVNKTDCMTLSSTFGSVEKMMKASKEDLSLCPGIGPQKAHRLYDVFHEPFLKSRKRLKPTEEKAVKVDKSSSPEKLAR